MISAVGSLGSLNIWRLFDKFTNTLNESDIDQSKDYWRVIDKKNDISLRNYISGRRFTEAPNFNREIIGNY